MYYCFQEDCVSVLGPSPTCQAFNSAIGEKERMVTYRQILVHISGMLAEPTRVFHN